MKRINSQRLNKLSKANRKLEKNYFLNVTL